MQLESTILSYYLANMVENSLLKIEYTKWV